MSSNYSAICLSHDPALMIDPWLENHTDKASALARARTDHATCSLLVGRWSGSIVEVCCPAQSHRIASIASEPPVHNWGIHLDDQWVGAGWLRLLALADEKTRKKAGRTGCWSYDTARRLAKILDVEGTDP